MDTVENNTPSQTLGRQQGSITICGRMQVGRANSNMMCGRMVLGEIVRKIGLTAFPIDNELALSNAVANPIKTNVDCFGSPSFDHVVSNAHCSAVIRNNGSRGLIVAQFNEC